MDSPAWTHKKLALVLNVHPKKINQSWTPALRKFCLAQMADPVATTIAVAEMMAQIKAERQSMTGKPGVRFAV